MYTCIPYISTYIHTYIHIPDIGLGVRVFANGPGDLGSIPGRVIPKTQKMVLDASLLNTQHYKVRIKGKVEQSREGVAPSPTPWCSSYRKGSLRVTLDYGRQLYFTYIHTLANFESPLSLKEVKSSVRVLNPRRNCLYFTWKRHQSICSLPQWWGNSKCLFSLSNGFINLRFDNSFDVNRK